jgi:D-glycero-D-manno-heptose 1,7-bisphosphate phosphatase
LSDGLRRPEAVFLDRDGVINRKAPEGEYVVAWSQFEFLPGALEGLAALAAAPLRIVVATNQRAIARGLLTEAALADLHARMLDAVAAAGGRIDAIYHCPHLGGCDCRKPAPGMLRQAERELGLDLRRSAMVGDRAHDIEAAAAVGALRVLVAGFDEPRPDVDHVARDLRDASRWLLSLPPRA